ncbi:MULTISPECIES: helix-turn-helix transcriptional regulator [unclassified Stappia]|uniref:ArsR/SmtB family transcription factor n=1 Tax=unclassified Stappia TaxID=2629676 RepID=UPI001643ABE9|nr:MULTISPECIES: metalloregulator ArsR/SmtB family transcription factor [unclassified Stappia]
MIDALQERAEDAASFLKMLASAPRLMLLCHMANGETNVGQLAELTGMRMPTVSQQLALLRAQGLVRTRREGTTIYYTLDSEIAQDVLSLLEKHFCPPETTARARRRLETAGAG